MSPLHTSFEDTDVLDHFLEEPASLHSNQSFPKLFLVRKTDDYTILRCKFSNHNIVLGNDEDQHYARCRDKENHWGSLLATSSANTLVNGYLLRYLNPDSKAMRNAKEFFPPSDVTFPRIKLGNQGVACFNCKEENKRHPGAMEANWNVCVKRCINRKAKNNSEDDDDKMMEMMVYQKASVHYSLKQSLIS